MERYLKDEPHHVLPSSALSSVSSLSSPVTLSSVALRRADSFEMLPCVQPSSVCASNSDASPMWSFTVKQEVPDADDTDAEDAVGGSSQLFDDLPPSKAEQHKIALR